MKNVSREIQQDSLKIEYSECSRKIKKITQYTFNREQFPREKVTDAKHKVMQVLVLPDPWQVFANTPPRSEGNTPELSGNAVLNREKETRGRPNFKTQNDYDMGHKTLTPRRHGD